ncbi:HNH endonuclease [Caballeronia cordobensis]|uniref:HNH endonuclease n=1 Tax=Caballeronia cordobensis TaxID=1353886 RepID=UPI00045EFE37|nr:putative membrane protein [Burkholderia sp. RPE67]
MTLTAERLRQILTYCPATGEFRWNMTRGKNAIVGMLAGSKNAKGYLIISIEGRGYRAHRLAWLHMTGEWPESDIDHINMDKADNRFSNLRSATRAQNIWNTCARIGNKSGHKGVWFDKASGLWAACITLNYRRTWLGRFPTKEEAAMAYGAAAAKTHGEFLNTGVAHEGR